jgi:predicted DNA-binding protein
MSKCLPLKGKRRQISHTIPPDLLVRVDAMAAKTGNTRASLINLAIYRAVEHGIVKE